MADSLIRWKRSDYVKLGKAISSFNKKIRELEVDEAKYLPSMKDYKEIKNEILSRKELNRIVNSLRKFSNEGMDKKIKLSSGQELTKWEYQETKYARNRAIRRLELEKEKVEKGEKFPGMGDERISYINASIRNMKNLENYSGISFRNTISRIEMLGSKDYELKVATQYRENFMNALEEMSTFENYDSLINKLNSIKNPIKFYEYISQNEILKDLFLYYKDKATSQTYGGFASNQDAFNTALEQLGII